MVSFTEFDWSSEVGKQVEIRLRELWINGNGAGTIAKQLNIEFKNCGFKFTKNMVAGRKARIGLVGNLSRTVDQFSVGIQRKPQPSEAERAAALKDIMKSLISEY
jgi:hypothetical protein